MRGTRARTAAVTHTEVRKTQPRDPTVVAAELYRALVDERAGAWPIRAQFVVALRTLAENDGQTSRALERLLDGLGTLHRELPLREGLGPLTHAEAELLRGALGELAPAFAKAKISSDAVERAHEAIERATVVKPSRPYRWPSEVRGPTLPAAAQLARDADPSTRAELEALASGDTHLLAFTRAHRVSGDQKTKTVELATSRVALRVSYSASPDGFLLDPSARVLACGREMDVELTPALAELVTRATLSLGQVERASVLETSLGGTRSSVLRVSLDVGGDAILRARPFHCVVDHAVSLLAQGLGVHSGAPVVGFGAKGPSLAAFVPGFRGVEELPRGTVARHAEGFDAIDVWNFVIDNVDASASNVGLDGTGRPRNVDLECAFAEAAPSPLPVRLKTNGGPGYYRAEERRPCLEVPAQLVAAFAETDAATIYRLMKPAGLPGLRRIAMETAARMSYVVELATSHDGRLPREACTPEGFAARRFA